MPHHPLAKKCIAVYVSVNIKHGVSNGQLLLFIRGRNELVQPIEMSFFFQLNSVQNRSGHGVSNRRKETCMGSEHA